MASKKSKGKQIPMDDGFLMSPKVDFVFKLIFGDEKNKYLLIAFLSAVLGVPAEEFEGIEIINSELIREFAEDRKGILDEEPRRNKENRSTSKYKYYPWNTCRNEPCSTGLRCI